MNIAHPNSIKNTGLLSVFKADDSTTNLHIALDMYREHVKESQGMKIRLDNNAWHTCIIPIIHMQWSYSSSLFLWWLRIFMQSVWPEWSKWYAFLLSRECNIIIIVYIHQVATTACGVSSQVETWNSHSQRGEGAQPGHLNLSRRITAGSCLKVVGTSEMLSSTTMSSRNSSLISHLKMYTRQVTRHSN